MMHYDKHYIPLESDPQIFTDLMYDLGVSRSLKFADVWSLDEIELHDFPRPVHALILVLPSCPAYEEQKTEKIGKEPDVAEVIWLKQTINNACGLYAILHCVCNIPGIIEAESPIDGLIKSADRVAYLESSKNIEQAYATAAQRGLSEAPSSDAEMDHHYICLIKRSNRLFVLDGDMDGPIQKEHLAEDENILSQKVLDILMEYTQSEQEGTFSLLALVNV